MCLFRPKRGVCGGEQRDGVKYPDAQGHPPSSSSRVEGQLIGRYPEVSLESRNLLHHIDYKRGTVQIGGRDYPLLDRHFPTVDPADPYRADRSESEIMDRLEQAFLN